MTEFVQSGLAAWWAPALAFAAGLVSFASPCVLPLVPGYLSFVTGTQPSGASTAGEGAVAVRTQRRLLPMLLFVAGFAVVFTSLGAFAGTLLPVIRSSLGLRIAGVVVLLFGVLMLAYAFRLRVPALYEERRPLLSRIRPGPAAAFPLGMAFAAGWTPCIGPVLAGTLALASTQGTSARGALLLFFYSLGLGLPFVLIGLGVGRLMRSLDWVKRNYHWIGGTAGAVMVTIGVLLITGLWLQLMAPVLRLVNAFEPPI